MAKTAIISIHIDPKIKAQTEEVFSNFGISVTDAINVFLRTSIMNGGFPFKPQIPRYNRTTLQAMQEARNIMTGNITTKHYSSLADIVADIEEYHDT